MRSLDVSRIQTALSDSVVGRRIHYRHLTGSTMDDAPETSPTTANPRAR